MKDFWNTKIELPKTFIFGYGSIINEKSRNLCNNEIYDVIPARLSSNLGYRRCWNYRCSTSKFTALGLEKVPINEACTINGVLYPIINNNLSYFDEREEGYDRIKINNKDIESCCWINIPDYDCDIYIYIPKKENTHYPNNIYPYLQSYLDMCILGCLKYGEDFAKEFLQTTLCWNNFWLDDRILSRRPWVYQSNFKIIDSLLKDDKTVNKFFKNKKIETIVWNNT